MDKAELDKLRELAQKASPGPWKAVDWTEEELGGYSSEYYLYKCPHGCKDGHCDGHEKEHYFDIDGITRLEDDYDGWWFNEADARFIVAAHESLPKLLDYIDHLEMRLKETEAEVARTARETESLG